MRNLRELLTLREALERAKRRPPELQAAITGAYRRSRERARVADNLWLAGAPGALDAAREALTAALEAARLLTGVEDDAEALRELGLDEDATKAVLDARETTSVRGALAQARRVRRAIAPEHRDPDALRRRRRVHAAVAVGLIALGLWSLVADIHRRVELARAPWAASYWDDPEFDGAPTTTVGWRSPNHDWGSGGPFGERDGFSLRLRTCLRLEQPGTVSVVVRSDDGSRVFIDDELWVDNWGDHGPREARGQRSLAAGPHALRVDYYERGGGATLQVRIEADVPYRLSPGACD